MVWDVPPRSRLVIEVMDKDVMTEDDFLGSAAFMIDPSLVTIPRDSNHLVLRFPR